LPTPSPTPEPTAPGGPQVPPGGNDDDDDNPNPGTTTRRPPTTRPPTTRPPATTRPPSSPPPPSPTPSPTPPPANDPPVITNLGGSPDPIADWECRTDPSTGISFTVQDESPGTVTASASYSFSWGGSGSIGLGREGSSFGGSISIPYSGENAQGGTITVSVTATDDVKQTDNASTTITLNPCTPPVIIG
jgi:hypothetical protein